MCCVVHCICLVEENAIVCDIRSRICLLGLTLVTVIRIFFINRTFDGCYRILLLHRTATNIFLAQPKRAPSSSEYTSEVHRISEDTCMHDTPLYSQHFFLFLLLYSLHCLVAGLEFIQIYTYLPVALVCLAAEYSRRKERYIEREVGLGSLGYMFVDVSFFSCFFVPILYFFLPFCAQLP